MKLVALLVLASTCEFAQEPERPIETPRTGESHTIALQWAVATADGFTRLPKVVSAWSLDRMATLVCPHDPVAAEGIFRQALASFQGIVILHYSDPSDLRRIDVFEDPREPPLPVASYKRLWTPLAAHVRQCAPQLVPQLPEETAKKQMELESQNVNLSQYALFKAAQGRLGDNPERAMQLVELILQAADPDQIDYGEVETFLVQLRARAYELGDDLFKEALAAVIATPRPNITAYGALGRYLFGPPSLSSRGDSQNAGQVGLGGIPDLRDQRGVASSAAVQAYMEGLVDFFNATTVRAGSQVDPVVGYGLALQMANHAQELELSVEQPLREWMKRLSPSSLEAIQAQFGTTPQDANLNPEMRDYRRVLAIRRMVEKGQIPEAREALSSIADLVTRRQVTPVVEFAEVVETIKAGNLALAAQQTNQIQIGGVKRTLLYTSLSAKLEPSLAEPLTSLALGDIQKLTPEYRASLSSAVAIALMQRNPERAYSFLQLIQRSLNEARISPWSARLDPRETSDVARGSNRGDVGSVPLARREFVHLVDTGQHQIPFRLLAPGVDGFTLAAVMKKITLAPDRTEAVLLDLSDERERAAALLGLAESRLQ